MGFNFLFNLQQPKYKLLDILPEESDVLESQSEDFTTISKSIQMMVCFNEEQDTPDFGLVSALSVIFKQIRSRMLETQGVQESRFSFPFQEVPRSSKLA